jgi:uncharacterized phiE125 gp8 family phage protein
MPLSYRETSQPVVEPVTLAQAKVQLALPITFADDDSLITALIVAARNYVEKKMKRSIFNRTMEYYLDQFPLAWIFGNHGPFNGQFTYLNRYNRQIEIRLPQPGAVSVQSIIYFDSNMTEQTLDPSTYYVDVKSEPARIRPTQGNIWPIANLYTPNAVTIAFTSGTWGDGVTVNNCPQAVCQAMLLLISYWYFHRSSAETNPPKAIEDGVDALLSGYKFGTYLWN